MDIVKNAVAHHCNSGFGAHCAAELLDSGFGCGIQSVAALINKVDRAQPIK
jgi:hypothetical protein